MASGEITIEVTAGPVLRRAMQVLDVASEVLDLVPEWNAIDRDKLQRRVDTLKDELQRQLARQQ